MCPNLTAISVSLSSTGPAGAKASCCQHDAGAAFCSVVLQSCCFYSNSRGSRANCIVRYTGAPLYVRVQEGSDATQKNNRSASSRICCCPCLTSHIKTPLLNRKLSNFLKDTRSLIWGNKRKYSSRPIRGCMSLILSARLPVVSRSQLYTDVLYILYITVSQLRCWI